MSMMKIEGLKDWLLQVTFNIKKLEEQRLVVEVMSESDLEFGTRIQKLRVTRESIENEITRLGGVVEKSHYGDN